VVSFPAGTRDLTLLQMRPEGLWDPKQPAIQCVPGALSQGGKAGREADHSSASRTEVKQ
jgi:hypothetical protein